MKENEKWIDALRKRLDDYAEPTPASGWERLERELLPPVEKRIYPYRRWAVAAAAVVLVAATSVSIYFLNSPVADGIRHTPALATTPDILPEPSLPGVQVMPAEPVKPFGIPHVKGSRILAKAEAKVIVPTSELLSKEKEEVAIVTVSEDVVKKEDKAEYNEPKQVVRRPSSRDKLHLPDENTVAHQKGKWSIGASVGNGGSSSSDGGDKIYYGGGAQRVNLSSMANSTIIIPEDKELVYEDGVPYLQAPVREIPKIKHHLPVTVGISVRKSLPKGFSVETGLSYTLLSSDVTMAGYPKVESQKLHYLGIPVRANWNFYDKKRFTLYVSGGGMVEKCVYGKQAGEKINVDPLQFSVMGAVGAQFNASQHVGVYVEPGISYFFDDKSSVQTIRKETPLNFNLQAGIRFTY